MVDNTSIIYIIKNMKYYKFEKKQKGKNPIIRVTYKNWWGKLIVKDIVKSTVEGFWVFMENGCLVHKDTPINNFYNNDDDVYWVNGRIFKTSKKNFKAKFNL